MPKRAFYKLVLIIVGGILACSPYNTFAQKPTAKTFFDIGLKNSENAEYSEAIDAFKHAINLKPDYAEAYYYLGDAFFNLHRYTEAFDAFKQAVKIKPNYVEAHFSLGILASMLSEYDEAIKAFKKVVELNPKHAKAYFSLGNVYSELNRHEEAVEAYKKAIDIMPKFTEARYHLGIAYLELRKQLLKYARQQYNYLKRVDKDLAQDLLKKIRSK
jgi:tetratricopeptide (TPR) repeat protein